MNDLNQKVAVVTGAASGIGLGIAARLAGEGMRLVLADIDGESLDRAVEHLSASGFEVMAWQTDVSNPGSVDDLATATLERFGAVHVVCNNAGVLALGPAWEIGHDVWEWVVGVNFMGVVNGVRTFVPHLLRQGEGHIVNTASMAGLLASGFTAPYTATKHAVVGLSECLFHELKGTGIGVSVVCPGFIKTRLMDADRNWPGDPKAGPGSPRDPGGRSIEQLFAAGIESGDEPAQAVGAPVVDAIRGQRFWVLTHADLASLVVPRFAAAAEGRNPDG